MKVRKVFAESDDVYGAPRVHAQLAGEGTFVDRKTVAKSMLRQGLEGVSPKKFTPVTTIPGVDTYKIPDRVKRGWDQGAFSAADGEASIEKTIFDSGLTSDLLVSWRLLIEVLVER